MGILGDGTFTNLSQMRNDIEMQKNQNAFPFLGRTVLEEQQLLAPVGPLSSCCQIAKIILQVYSCCLKVRWIAIMAFSLFYVLLAFSAEMGQHKLCTVLRLELRCIDMYNCSSKCFAFCSSFLQPQAFVCFPGFGCGHLLTKFSRLGLCLFFRGAPWAQLRALTFWWYCVGRSAVALLWPSAWRNGVTDAAC